MGPTVNPCTKGIYIWGKPILLDRPNEEPLHVLLVDTEGIGSIQQDQTYDVKIFSLAILLSSYFVYNSLSIIDERALDGLSLVVNLTKQISVRSNAAGGAGAKKGGRNSVGPKSGSGAQGSSNTSNGNAAVGRNSKGGGSSSSSGAAANPNELADYFPSFLWLLRDFALDLVDERGSEITPRQYLENALRERPEASQQSKNAIRSSIKQLFRDRDCFTLVRPVVDEKQLRTIDAIPYNQLRSEFRVQSEELVQKIFDEAPVKTINGQALTGDSFVSLLGVYTEAINSGAVASIQNAWESVSSQVNQQAMEEAFHVWTSGISARYNPNRPLGDEQLQALNIECMNEAFGMFDSMSYQSAQTAAIRKNLKQKMAAEYARLIQANREASSRFVLRLLNTLYEPLDAKAKSGQIKSMEALLDAWAALRKHYFDQLGDAQASRLVAFDEFIKFFSTHVVTTSAHVMRTIQEAHGSKLEDLKKQLEALKTEKHALEMSSVKALEEAKRIKELYGVTQKRVQELEKDSASKLEQLHLAQKQSHSLQSELTKTLSETNKLTAEMRSHMAATQAAESKISESKEKLAAALDAKLKAHEEHKRAIAQLQKEIANLESQVSTTESNRNKAERTLQVQLDKANRENASLKVNLETLSAQVEALKSAEAARDAKEAKSSAAAKESSASAAAKVAKAEATNKVLVAQNDALAEQAETLKAQIDKMVKQNDASSKSRENAHSELESVKAARDKALRENEKLKAKAAELVVKLEQAEVEASANLAQAHTAQAVAESAHEQNAEELQAALEESQLTIEELHAHCATLEATIERLQRAATAAAAATTTTNASSSVFDHRASEEPRVSTPKVPKSTSAAANAFAAARHTASSAAKTKPKISASTPSAKAKASKKTTAAKFSSAAPSSSATTAAASRSIPDLSDSEDDYYDAAAHMDTASDYETIANSGNQDFFPEDAGSEFDVASDEESYASHSAATSSTPATKRSSKKATAAKAASSSKPSSKSASNAASVSTPKRATKATAAASRKSLGAPVIPDLSDSESEEEVVQDLPKRTPAKRATKATSAKRTSLDPSALASSSSMDIDDFDLPTPSSRKRSRADTGFSETEEFAFAALGTPMKKAQNDPVKMDKATLKAHLTSAGVKLPPEDHPKPYYIALFNKHIARRSNK